MTDEHVQITIEVDATRAIYAFAFAAYQSRLCGEYWWSGHQLTTGHHTLCPARYSTEAECAGPGYGFCVDVVDCTCQYVDTGTLFHRWTDPQCRFHGEPLRPRPVERYGKTPACMCLYGLRKVEGVVGVMPIDPYRRFGYRVWGAWAFKIHPRCPHHGDARTAYLEVSRETLAEIVLDEDERNNR